MKPYSIALTTGILMLLLGSCCNESDTSKMTASNTEKESETLSNDTKALTLMNTQCFTCHHPDMNRDDRVAPPIFKIREHYYDDEITRDEFINQIVSFASDPTEEKSIMYGAVQNFGLMPKQNFKEDDLKLIAGYLYDNDVSSDEWYTMWEEFEKEQQKK
jgi:cytochrome c551/c552